MSKIVERILATMVTPDQLVEALSAVDDLEPEDRSDITARTLSMFARLDGTVPDLASTVTVIDWRLRALARIARRPELRRWSIPPDPAGMALVAYEVLEAAAVEPLIEQGDDLVFDPDSFFRRLLNVSDSDGSA